MFQLDAVMYNKPAGMLKHFRVAVILERMSAHVEDMTAADLWRHLATMYNMDRDPIQHVFKSFFCLNFQDSKSEEIKSFTEKLGATIDKNPNLMIPKDIKSHLLYSTRDGIILQNPLLIKSRYSSGKIKIIVIDIYKQLNLSRYLCQTSEENHNAIKNFSTN